MSRDGVEQSLSYDGCCGWPLPSDTSFPMHTGPFKCDVALHMGECSVHNISALRTCVMGCQIFGKEALHNT